MNFFQPTVKLINKERIGSKLIRKYSSPQTPLDRVMTCDGVAEETKAALNQHRTALDPFTLSEQVEAKLLHISNLASQQTLVKTRSRSSWMNTKAPDEYIPDVAA